MVYSCWDAPWVSEWDTLTLTQKKQKQMVANQMSCYVRPNRINDSEPNIEGRLFRAE